MRQPLSRSGRALAVPIERRRVVLAAMCVGYFLVLLDVTIVNVALPHIRSGLHASVAGLQWVVDAYAVVLASGMLAAGTIGDIRGHRRIVLGGLVLFGLSSAACGLAPNTGMLAAARSLQGLSAALLLPGTLAIIAATFPGDDQPRAIGVWASVGSVALPAGPLVGGALVQAFGWRSIFFINVPIVMATLAVAVRVTPERTERSNRRVDVPGTLIGAAFLASLTLAFIEAGRAGLSPAVGIAAVGAAVALAAFVRVEARAPDPMLPLSLFRNRSFSTANGVAATMNLCTLGMLFVLTLYLQDVRGYSPLAAGTRLLPLFLPLVVIAPVAGRLTARRGATLPIASGLLVSAAGLLLLAASGLDSGYGVLFPALLLWGSGLGLLTPAVVAAAMGAVPTERGGLASATNNTARQAGGAVGIAAFGALAGSPDRVGAFVNGMRAGGVTAACLYVVAAGVSLALIRQRRDRIPARR